MAWFDDPNTLLTLLAAVVVIATIVCVTLFFWATRVKGKPTPKPKPTPTQNADYDYNLPPTSSLPFKISKSVQTTAAVNAKDELRMLDLEREILSDAIRRLYEAQAEGKINEQEREKLAGSYKARMNTIKQSIAKDETIVALHELESMQEDMMKLFRERFGELTTKVDELRTRIDVKPVREVQIKIPTSEILPAQIETAADEIEEEETVPGKVENKDNSAAQAAKKIRKPPVERTDQKTEAEKRIETIRSEVEKVLDKLGQMEVEG